jgi:rhodanese-related sulfurtransferase
LGTSLIRPLRILELMTEVKSLTVDQLGALERAIREGGYVLVDVRERHEYATGHIPMAENRPLSELARWCSEASRDRPIILYCRTSNRSRRCAHALSTQGFREVYVLDGGYSAWSAADR